MCTSCRSKDFFLEMEAISGLFPKDLSPKECDVNSAKRSVTGFSRSAQETLLPGSLGATSPANNDYIGI